MGRTTPPARPTPRPGNRISTDGPGLPGPPIPVPSHRTHDPLQSRTPAPPPAAPGRRPPPPHLGPNPHRSPGADGNRPRGDRQPRHRRGQRTSRSGLPARGPARGLVPAPPERRPSPGPSHRGRLAGCAPEGLRRDGPDRHPFAGLGLTRPTPTTDASPEACGPPCWFQASTTTTTTTTRRPGTARAGPTITTEPP